MKDSTTTQASSVSMIAPVGPHVLPRKPDIFDLYSMAYGKRNHRIDTSDKTVPFTHPVKLKNPDGTMVQVTTLFDDGAMAGAMCTSVFNRIKPSLHGWQPSSQVLRMANGAIVPSEATWSGTIHVEGVETTRTFEVFDSGGGWSFLFGKPLLRAFKAKHDYETDEVTITNSNTMAILCNYIVGADRAPTTNTMHHTTTPSGPADTSMVVPPLVQETNTQDAPQTKTSTAKTAPTNTDSIFTRLTDLFKAARVEYIVQSIKIGNDLSTDKTNEVVKLLTEYMDIFACSLSEVLPIPGAQVNLNIPEDTTFRTTVHQRPMNPPQRQFMHRWVDQMLDANLIETAKILCIKHVAPTVLTQKVHNANGGMTLEDLQHELNQQCLKANVPQPFQADIQNHKQERTKAKPPDEAPKWRVMQNFTELNKAMQIPPMFHRDIRAKQQQLSGHRYISIFDFASGFYAIEIPEKWRPYFTFFMDRRGYLWYKRMAMGWTGAPTIFSAVVTDCLHDILADDTMKLFVDNGGCRDDMFPDMMAKL